MLHWYSSCLKTFPNINSQGYHGLMHTILVLDKHWIFKKPFFKHSSHSSALQTLKMFYALSPLAWLLAKYWSNVELYLFVKDFLLTGGFCGVWWLISQPIWPTAGLLDNESFHLQLGTMLCHRQSLSGPIVVLDVKTDATN